jgi:hypothetical protein
MEYFAYSKRLSLKRKKASTLTILDDQCVFGPAEVRIVRDVDSKRVWSVKRYAVCYV